jgi:hypothetical protein|tara:strand:- start:454 stop:834 length:381 start_codon:yes stop_codon:yes gene_type:complete
LVKNILLLASVLILGACSTIGKYLPSDFDNVEYGKLVELNVVSAMGEDGLWCMKPVLSQMNYRSFYLHTYSKNRLNENITEIYKGLHGLTTELVERENPSDAYCRIKRTNIHNITSSALEVFGDRK